MMISTISAHRGELDDLCRRFYVRRLDLFGSAARGEDFTNESDIDFLVEFEMDHTPPALGDFLALRQALAALFGREVDLTMAGSIRNPFLQAAIARSRVTLHGA
jgi:predicted nucleotidyltransferase